MKNIKTFFLKENFSGTLLLIFAGMLVAVVTGSILLNELVWDDKYFISKRSQLGSLNSLIHDLTSPFWANSALAKVLSFEMWRPFTSLVLWVGGFVFGTWHMGFRLLSVIAFFGMIAAYARFLITLTGEKEKIVPALWLALIFASHPVQVEVFGLVAGISDFLMFFFLLLQLTIYTKSYPNSPTHLNLAAAGVLGFLACSSKETGLAGLVSPLIAYFFIRFANRNHDNRNASRFWTKGVILSSVIPVITYLILRYFVTYGLSKSIIDKINTDFLYMVFISWGQFVYSVLVPTLHGLHIYISHEDVLSMVLSLFLSILFILSICLFILRKSKIAGYFFGGQLFAFILLVPSMLGLNINELGASFPVRYFAIPAGCLFIAIFPVLLKFYRKRHALFGFIVVLLLTSLSYVRSTHYRNPVSLWAVEVEKHPNYLLEVINLAGALCDKGMFEEAQKALKPIRDNISRCSPRIKGLFHAVMGEIVVFKSHDFKKAAFHYSYVLKLNPANLDIRIALCEALSQDGKPNKSVDLILDAFKKNLVNPLEEKKMRKHLERYRKKLKNKAVK